MLSKRNDKKILKNDAVQTIFRKFQPAKLFYPISNDKSMYEAENI